MLYEYKILEGDSLPNEENLHALDADGWILVQIIDRGGYVYVYLKRRRQHSSR